MNVTQGARLSEYLVEAMKVKVESAFPERMENGKRRLCIATTVSPERFLRLFQLSVFAVYIETEDRAQLLFPFSKLPSGPRSNG